MGVDLMVSPGVMDVALNPLVMRPIACLPRSCKLISPGIKAQSAFKNPPWTCASHLPPLLAGMNSGE